MAIDFCAAGCGGAGAPRLESLGYGGTAC